MTAGPTKGSRHPNLNFLQCLIFFTSVAEHKTNLQARFLCILILFSINFE